MFREGIDKPQRGSSAYNKWHDFKGKPSHREILRIAIDEALEQKPHDFDAFLSLLSEKGFSVKNGKHLTFTHADFKQNIRMESNRPPNMNHNILPKKTSVSTRSSLTYDELLDSWLHSSQLNTKESTHARYAHLIRTHIKPQLGKYQLSMLSTEIIESFIEFQLTDRRLDNTGGGGTKDCYRHFNHCKKHNGIRQL